MSSSSFIAALDVGTTTVRCFIVSEKYEVKGSASEAVELLNPQPGYFEIEPESLWRKIIAVITNAIKDAKLTPSMISWLSISSQRCTFLTWNHRTMDYYHNFITWKDLRSNYLVEQWNRSYTLKAINRMAYVLYLATGNRRFLAGSVLKMMNGQITLRLLHEIQTNAKLQQGIKNKTARLELLDSWILYKLRSGNGFKAEIEHISDISSCTATGIFDPFILDWSPLILFLFGIDRTLLPKVVDNSYQFGTVHPEIFKQCANDWKPAHIRIASSMSDQTAAILGSNCFNEGESKITIGTGAFFNLVTGRACHASVLGMYPLVAWQHRNGFSEDPTIFCIEGAVYDVGSVIEWAKSCGLINHPAESAAIAESIDSPHGVYFVAAFSGLGPPINDYKTASGFLGITPSTKRAHLIRAILESIVFRLALLCEAAESESAFKLKKLKIDGGVSRNNFICQFLADTTGIQVERAQNCESSIMGAALMAGFNSGLWNVTEEVRQFRKVDKLFKPCEKKRKEIKIRMDEWIKVTRRFANWYS